VSTALAEPALSAYRDAFAARGGERGEPEWLRTVRAHAFARFLELGIPGRKDEAWRQLDLGPIRDAVFPLAGAPGAAPGISGLREAVAHWPETNRLVFVNGAYAPELSEPPAADSAWRFTPLGASAFAGGARPAAFAELLPGESQPFAAWNTAFVRDGASVTLGRGAVAGEPLHLIFAAASPGVNHPRLLLDLGREASGVVLEEYVTLGAEAAFANAVGEIRLGDGSRLEHVRLQREAGNAIHVGALAVDAGRDARYRSTSFALGAGPARIDLHVRLRGEGAECLLHGLYVPDARRVIDHHTAIDHLVPHTTSRQLYKGILADRARSVFNGMIHIHENAQKTSAEQHNPNLLLSPDALANSNPQLRILADDVKCRHGSTIGKLEADKLFYLRSRGLPAEEAAMLLVTAFAAEILEGIGITAVRDALADEVARRYTAHV